MTRQAPNWCDLPVEMRMECVNQMDFETKMRMRATAHLEKEIVERSKKTVLQGIHVTGSRGDAPDVYVMSYHRRLPGILSTVYKGSLDKVVSLIKALLLFCKVDVFHISGDNRDRFLTNDSFQFLQRIVDRERFVFPVLNVHHLDPDAFHTLFELLPFGNQLIDFYGIPARALERVCRDPVTLPLMMDVPIIEVDNKDSTLTNTIVNAWIANDQEIGKKVLVFMGGVDHDNEFGWEDYEEDSVEEAMLSEFKTSFAERVVNEDESSVRITTDNSAKHIVFRIVQEEDEDPRDIRIVAMWQVIPADLDKDDYEKTTGFVYAECLLNYKP